MSEIEQKVYEYLNNYCDIGKKQLSSNATVMYWLLEEMQNNNIPNEIEAWIAQNISAAAEMIENKMKH